MATSDRPTDVGISQAIKLGSAQLTLLPERAVWWEAQQTLFVADVHLGKDAKFRRHGSPLPDLTRLDLARLEQLVREYHPRELWILGDLLHCRDGRESLHLQANPFWLSEHNSLSVNLLRGNHDQHAGDPPLAWNVTCVDEPFEFHSVWLTHHPDFTGNAATLSGHLHPKIRLRQGGDEVRLPCFWRHRQCLVLPAFASFVDHGLIKPNAGDDIYPCTDDRVFHQQIPHAKTSAPTSVPRRARKKTGEMPK